MSENKTYSRQFKADATLKVFLEMMQGEASTYPWSNEELDNFSRWTGIDKSELKNKTAEELEKLAPFVMTVEAKKEGIYVPFEPTVLEGFGPISTVAYVNGEPTDITISEDGTFKVEINGLKIGEEVEIAIPAGYQFLAYKYTSDLSGYYTCKELNLMSRAVLHGVSYGLNGLSAALTYNTASEVSPKLLNYIDREDERVRLANLFYRCYRLKSVPEYLFAGFSKCVADMFNGTFNDCSNLTSVPEELFSNINGSAPSMFYSTFSGCGSLEAIPKRLFAGVKGSASHLFCNTFAYCYSLTTVPEGLFAGIEGNATYMFGNVFFSCKNILTIPNNLFSGVSESSYGLFMNSFYNCESLLAIPEGLFAGVSGEASFLFSKTFFGCKSLKGATPRVQGKKLWELATGDKQGEGCFKDCTGLADYKEIPDTWK
ncbi:hypothetical protein [uncultured Porphyromonas sp.]|uniref:hypothetical protein n=1 Tax=uncultured Porphyromonas sp. TaxID=159274 RepID=UPI0025918722|nr:hypothetical protein [uncultured Porphyromonas sp.]